jgi:hypothetical protein
MRRIRSWRRIRSVIAAVVVGSAAAALTANAIGKVLTRAQSPAVVTAADLQTRVVAATAEFASPSWGLQSVEARTERRGELRALLQSIDVHGCAGLLESMKQLGAALRVRGEVGELQQCFEVMSHEASGRTYVVGLLGMPGQDEMVVQAALLALAERPEPAVTAMVSGIRATTQNGATFLACVRYREVVEAEERIGQIGSVTGKFEAWFEILALRGTSPACGDTYESGLGRPPVVRWARARLLEYDWVNVGTSLANWHWCGGGLNVSVSEQVVIEYELQQYVSRHFHPAAREAWLLAAGPHPYSE